MKINLRPMNLIKIDDIGVDWKFGKNPDPCAGIMFSRTHNGIGNAWGEVASPAGCYMKRSAPPLASIVSPVTKLLRAEARNATMAAISSGWAK